MIEEPPDDFSEYLVIFDISPTATAYTVLTQFERFGQIDCFCFPGKECHIGRAFIKFSESTGKESCLQMAGYNNFEKPAYEKIVSSIYVQNMPVIVTPIQEKDAVLMRRKQKKSRNMHLLNIGNDVGDSYYEGEDELRRNIIDNRKSVFFSDADYSISKKTVCFYNCPRNMKKLLLREIFREGVENFVLHNRGIVETENKKLADQIDPDKIRITNITYHEDDETTTITFSTHQQALAAIKQLNGDSNAFTTFRPILHFDLRKKTTEFPGSSIIPEHPLPPK